MKRYIIPGILIVILVTLIGFKLFPKTSSSAVSPDAPGLLADEGSGHVPIGTQVVYKTNPPTSGSHYANWARKGVYQQVLEDPLLVHSLEHGYIIISYNCAYRTSSVSKDATAEGMLQMSEEEVLEASRGGNIPESDLPSSFKTDRCINLRDQLVQIYKNKGENRLIILPRPSLDSQIALAAWRRLDKFSLSDSILSQDDNQRINNFIDSYRDQGPEKVME